jgi:hypothetical protein
VNFLAGVQSKTLPKEKKRIIKPQRRARHGWLMPVILATQDSEIRRMAV